MEAIMDGYQALQLHVPTVYKSRELSPPGTVGSCPSLYGDSFTFFKCLYIPVFTQT